MTLNGAISDDTLRNMRARYSDEVCRKYIAVKCWYNFFNLYLIFTRVRVDSEQEIIEKVGDKTMLA